MRHPHQLKHNTSSETPRHIIFFDTETTEHDEGQEKHLKLKLGVAKYYRTDRKKVVDRCVFRSNHAFWKFVYRRVPEKSKLILVAHNIPFDFRVVRGFINLRVHGYRPEKIVSSGVRVVWSFRRKNRTIVVMDNMNFFSMSLRTLGASIGLQKLELDDAETDEKLVTYCERDVDIMVKAWEVFFDFLKVNNLGNMAYTIASQAFNAFRHRFMKEDIFIHTNEKIVRLERESYHGGRVECFRIGTMPTNTMYYLLDVNSMYPSVMSEFTYPVKFLESVHDSKLFLKEFDFKRYGCIAEVVINTDDPVFPIELEGKLVFPVGQFKTTLTTRELEYAMKKGIVLSVGKCAFYKMKNIFADYVRTFYELKTHYGEQHNEAFRFICKLFLNSLYGKFGQHNEEWEKCKGVLTDDGISEIFDADTGASYTERRINGVSFRTNGQKVEGYNSFVAIPSHVTADARMKLWNIIMKAGRDNVFYCDTDSIITNFEGKERVASLIGKELGQLSVKESSRTLILNGAKDYQFGENIVIKGIRNDAVEISDSTYRQIRFEGFSGALRNGRINDMFIAPVIKHLKRKYDKGIVLPDGKVDPFKIDTSC